MKYKRWVIVSLVALLLMVWRYSVDSKTKIVFCDVGQGDGMLLQKGSFQMLIDVGEMNQKMLGCLSKYVPFWDKKIEVVVISHWDSDHSGGLRGIQKYYEVEKLYCNVIPPKESEQNVYPTVVEENDIIRYGDIDFEVLSIGSEDGETNEKSIIGWLSYMDNSSNEFKNILMLGDTSMEIEQGLVWKGVLRQGFGTLDILKVSHHGSNRATSDELLDELKPKTAVISVGKNNKFGHPAKEVIEKLEKRGIKIHRTDIEGDISVTY